METTFGVLDGFLEGKSHLVGDKISISDLIFVPAYKSACMYLIPGSSVDLAKYPNFKRWMDELSIRSSVVECYKERQAWLDANNWKL